MAAITRESVVVDQICFEICQFSDGVGTSAGLENTSGADNVFIGVNAGDSNASGASNTFVGRNAGQANTTTGFHSFFGFEAGYSNTSGFNNAFFGSRAGKANNEGFGNTFIGSLSGEFSTTGDKNTFLGWNTGETNRTGNNNTLIGANVNVTSNNLQYATAIGADVTVDSSNTVVIGRQSDDVVVRGGLITFNPIKNYLLDTGGNQSLCYNSSAFTFASCSSSLRYKTDIKPFAGGLDIVRRLKPITFNWRQASQSRDVGFGAEEVAKVDPLLVTYNEKGTVEGVKYAQLSTVLVNAIQQQQGLIEQQTALMERQQRQIEGLRKLVCKGRSRADVCGNRDR